MRLAAVELQRPAYTLSIAKNKNTPIKRVLLTFSQAHTNQPINPFSKINGFKMQEQAMLWCYR